MPQGEKLTQLLHAWSEGDAQALDRLMEAVHEDLRKIAASKLSRERAGHTLEPTALVHEAFLRLVELTSIEWKSRSQLYALATTFMRRILVEHARARRRARRGGGALHVTLHEQHAVASGPDVDLVDVDMALEKLAGIHPRKARVVELRCFGGMTTEEIAAICGTSVNTVDRDWKFGCTWLRRELSRR